MADSRYGNSRSPIDFTISRRSPSGANSSNNESSPSGTPVGTSTKADMVALLALSPAVGTLPPLASLLAPAPPDTVTLPFVGETNVVVQLNVLSLARDALLAGVAQLFVAPDGSAPLN